MNEKMIRSRIETSHIRGKGIHENVVELFVTYRITNNKLVIIKNIEGVCSKCQGVYIDDEPWMISETKAGLKGILKIHLLCKNCRNDNEEDE